jgi:hypothetical protein
VLYPQSPAIKSVATNFGQKTDVSGSDNGRDQAVSHAGGHLDFDAKYNKLNYLEAMRLRGFVAGLSGQAKTCDLILPVESHTLGDISGSTPRSNALTAAGSSTVAIKDALPNKTLRYGGEWIQFAGHDKAYMLTQDLVTDGAGNGTINLVPLTYEQILVNEQIIIDEVVFKVAASSDIVKTNLMPGMQYTFSVKLRESIR